MVIKVKVAGFSVSLDGFAAGSEQSLDHPLGKRGDELFQWRLPTRTFRAMFGQEGGDTGLDDCYGRRKRTLNTAHHDRDIGALDAKFRGTQEIRDIMCDSPAAKAVRTDTATCNV